MYDHDKEEVFESLSDTLLPPSRVFFDFGLVFLDDGLDDDFVQAAFSQDTVAEHSP